MPNKSITWGLQWKKMVTIKRISHLAINKSEPFEESKIDNNFISTYMYYLRTNYGLFYSILR